MINFKSINKAKSLAEKYHANQKDLSGESYIEHLNRISLNARTVEQATVAYLHDILEDTDCSESELKKSFSKEVVEAVKLLTKPKNERVKFPHSYFEKIKANKLAKAVKLLDLKDNMRLERIKNPTQKDFDRVEQYKLIYEYLSS